MIIVTGGAGFIGSNLIAGLNSNENKDILIVDDLTNGDKIININSLFFSDYCDVDDLNYYLERSSKKIKIEAIFHMGACSDTSEWNGKFLMKNNYEYSKFLFHWCQNNKIPFIYASSASVYGTGKNGFLEDSPECENPLNPYAFSKLTFDKYVFRQKRKFVSQVVGLRYFNVYGPNENHKLKMSSPIFSFFNQIVENKVAKVFESSHGYEDGCHERDFIFIDDCVKIKLWFLKNKMLSGIFNIGTSESNSFKYIAEQIIRKLGYGDISYIPMPKKMVKNYQSFTKANITKLRNVGYLEDFTSLENGITKYVDSLLKNQ